MKSIQKSLQNLALVTPYWWVLLTLYFGTVGLKLYLEHLDKPVPTPLFFGALLSSFWLCSAGINWAFARLK